MKKLFIMSKNNSRVSSKFMDCIPLQFYFNLTGNRPQPATLIQTGNWHDVLIF
jgi:hypothetical protein